MSARTERQRELCGHWKVNKAARSEMKTRMTK